MNRKGTVSRKCSLPRHFRPLPLGCLLLFCTCVCAPHLLAATDRPDQNPKTEIDIKTEPVRIHGNATERRAVDDTQLRGGRIMEVRRGTAAPFDADSSEATVLQVGQPDETGEDAAVAVIASETEQGREKAKPKAAPNFRGESVSSNRSMRVEITGKDQKTAHLKRGGTTKAQPLKSVVEYGESPELKTRNEKLRKIKEHFRTALDKRESRKAGSGGRRGAVEETAE